jgi:hypothetical protein
MVKGEIGFTRYNVAALLFSLALPSLSHHTLPILLCTSFGVMISFHGALLLDNTTWTRFVEVEELTMATFLVFNFLAHIMPALACYKALVYFGIDVLLIHGILAAALHVGWGLYVSYGKGVLDLSHIYVQMEHGQWKILWAIIIMVELILLPFFL